MSTLRKHLPKYDFSRMSAGAKTPATVVRLTSGLTRAKKAMLARLRSSTPGFFTLSDRTADLRASEAVARIIAKRAKTLIVLGIGGSDLGARAFVQALAEPGKGMDVRFLRADADPEELAALIASVDLRKCALNVVSKSGDTVEAMSGFLVLRDLLIKRVGKKRHARLIVATTDMSGGALREIARREGYLTLAVPADVGGRYSALTPVGLFPALCAGISAKKLLAGAGAARDAWLTEAPEKNAAMLFAGFQHDAYARAGRRVTVLMPYSARLEEFAFWFRQLWAESLGKARTRSGHMAHHGLTPIAALGPADQHSQVQLYNEGPDDKVVNLLGIERFRVEFAVPRAFADLAPLALLGGKRLGDIMRIEREATAKALASHGRPSGTLLVPAITPESVGALMMFFMLATAATAELLDVDAYDQPGVEEGKRLIKRSLQRS